MKKEEGRFIGDLVYLLRGIASVIVALSFGFLLIEGTFSIGFLPQSVNVFMGWLLVVITIVTGIISLFEQR